MHFARFIQLLLQYGNNALCLCFLCGVVCVCPLYQFLSRSSIFNNRSVLQNTGKKKRRIIEKKKKNKEMLGKTTEERKKIFDIWNRAVDLKRLLKLLHWYTHDIEKKVFFLFFFFLPFYFSNLTATSTLQSFGHSKILKGNLICRYQ